AAAVHAGGVAVALLANRRWRNDVLPHAAGAVLIAGSLWALQGLCPGRREWWGLALAAEAFILAVAGLVCERKVPIGRAAHRTPLFAGSLGLLLALFSGSFATDVTHTATTTTLALALLVPAVGRRDASLFSAFQVGLTVAVLCGVTAFAHPLGWLGDVRLLQ